MGSVMLLSNSLCAQDKSISTWYCQTQTGSDAASTASAFLVTEQKFWEFSVFWGKGLVLSRLRLVLIACFLLFSKSDWDTSHKSQSCFLSDFVSTEL